MAELKKKRPDIICVCFDAEKPHTPKIAPKN
jgi:hypothetical protein